MRDPISAFVTAYIEAALWSSTDDAGEPLDRAYSPDDIHPETLARMHADCAAFVAAHGFPEYNDPRYSDAEKAGHDFWLTRNGHGSGFWDRDLPETVSGRFCGASEAFGTFDLYVGDDGQIHGG